jgi:hypothetical protein
MNLMKYYFYDVVIYLTKFAKMHSYEMWKTLITTIAIDSYAIKMNKKRGSLSYI